jgi:hypothetical protein
VTLDPVTAAARRQNALDAIADDLERWGLPPDGCRPRAARLLDVIAAHGYALPVTADHAPLTGSGSTEEGRRRARELFEATRRAGQQPPDPAAAAPAAPGAYPSDPPGFRHRPDDVTKGGQP